MQAEIQIKFNDIDNALNILKKHFNWELSLNRIIELDKLIETENFWNDTSTAQSIMKEKKQLDKIIELLKLIEIILLFKFILYIFKNCCFPASKNRIIKIFILNYVLNFINRITR